ncbi:MAG: hypothetical protein HN884_06280, partial [Rhodospirillaceae bacterium]|nr:hypothetical protein [Rhodospirillaceae bacterium]
MYHNLQHYILICQNNIVRLGLRADHSETAPKRLLYPIKKWAAFMAILGAFSYAVMAGATVPTQRAFLMIGLVL